MTTKLLDQVLCHPALVQVAQRFAGAGIPLYLVGGVVRDALDPSRVGELDSPDLDCTTPASPEQILELVDSLGPVSTVGQRFGTIGVFIEVERTIWPIEITTHRAEVYEPGSRKPTVALVDDLRADLSRRDFTLNAMAVDVRNGELHDPFNGLRDLENGLLRTPADPDLTFSDDPLRTCRAVRFAVTRGWELDPSTAAAARRQAPRLEVVAIERIRVELEKALKSQRPGAFPRLLSLSVDLGISAQLLPGLCLELPEKALAAEPEDRLLAIVVAGALVHGDAGKEAQKLRKGLKIGNEVLERARAVSTLVVSCERGVVEGIEARRVVRKHDDSTLEQVVRLADCFSIGTAGLRAALEIREDLRAPLPIDGNDVVAAGLCGPAVGEALRKVTEEFLAQPSLSRQTALALIA